MPQWLLIMTAVIQILQTTGLLQVLIDIINKIITSIAGGTTPSVALMKQMPALMKLYAQLPAEAQTRVDEIILRL